jgi:hypothetical protein
MAMFHQLTADIPRNLLVFIDGVVRLSRKMLPARGRDHQPFNLSGSGLIGG